MKRLTEVFSETEINHYNDNGWYLMEAKIKILNGKKLYIENKEIDGTLEYQWHQFMKAEIKGLELEFR